MNRDILFSISDKSQSLELPSLTIAEIKNLIILYDSKKVEMVEYFLKRYLKIGKEKHNNKSNIRQLYT